MNNIKNMDFKKKIIIRSLLGVGIGLVLIFLFSTFLILQRNLNIPAVQASPGPECQVNDDLRVSGSIVGLCKTVVAGCLKEDPSTHKGDLYQDYGGPAAGRCDKNSDIAAVTCPAGYYVVGGGCSSTGAAQDKLNDSCPTNDINQQNCPDPQNAPNLYTSWFCDYGDPFDWEAAYAICCKIKP